MRALKAVCIVAVLLVVVVVGAILYVDNHAPVALQLLDRETPTLPVVVWLYAAFAAGTVLGFMLCFFGFVRGKMAQRRLQRTVRDRDRELDRLRDAQGPALAPEAAPISPPRPLSGEG